MSACQGKKGKGASYYGLLLGVRSVVIPVVHKHLVIM